MSIDKNKVSYLHTFYISIIYILQMKNGGLKTIQHLTSITQLIRGNFFQFYSGSWPPQFMLFLVKQKPQLSAHNKNLYKMTKKKHVSVPKENINYIFLNNAHVSISWFSLQLIGQSCSVSLAGLPLFQIDNMEEPRAQSLIFSSLSSLTPLMISSSLIGLNTNFMLMVTKFVSQALTLYTQLCPQHLHLDNL